MAINPDDLEDFGDFEREQAGFGRQTLKQKNFGFADPSGEFPRPENHFKPSLNKAATGEYKHRLSMGGGDPNIDLGTINTNLGVDIPSNYADVSVQETKSGHVLVFDDTPQGETVLIMHNTGSGIELRPDGSFMIKSEYNKIESIAGSSALVIEGDLKISCKNVQVDAKGDYNLNVKGDYNVNVTGDIVTKVDGSVRTEVDTNMGTIVKGNVDKKILGNETEITLKDKFDKVKGNYETSVEGAYNLASKGLMKQTSQTEWQASSGNINISGIDVSVISDYGTYGGENVIMYNYNMYTGHSIKAEDTVTTTTFYGSLKGKAEFAAAADVAGVAPLGGGAGGGTLTVIPVDPKETAKPTSAIMAEILIKSTRGIKQVFIDVGDALKKKISLVDEFKFIARKPTTGEARRALKDPANLNDPQITNALVSRKVISPSYTNAVPPSLGRSNSGNGTASYAPDIPLTSGAGTGGHKLVGGKRANKEFIPDLTYNPNSIPDLGPKTITAKTMVGRGIPISTFLAGAGGALTLNHIATFKERQEIARYLIMQAEVIKLCRYNKGRFKDARCVVSEGLYKPGPKETITPESVNDFAQIGRAITYELYDENNVSHPDLTFEFAEFLSEYLFAYDKIILHYDEFDPAGGLNVQFTVVMPEIDKNYKSGTPAFKLETYYNGKLQSNSDLLEITLDLI